LLEPQRTNLAIRSQEFDNSIWTTDSSFATVTADATTSKWSTANADKIVATTGSTAHYIRQTNITVVADKYTFSVLAKKAEWDTIELEGTNYWPSSPQGVFNLNTGVVFSATNATATIEDWGDGWYLCTVTATTNAIAGSNAKFQISIGNNNSLFVSGDNTSGLYVSDAQLELGTYHTSRIVTAGSTVTRLADASSTTGLSSVIGQSEGVFYVEMAALTTEISNRSISLSDGTTTIELHLLLVLL